MDNASDAQQIGEEISAGISSLGEGGTEDAKAFLQELEAKVTDLNNTLDSFEGENVQ